MNKFIFVLFTVFFVGSLAFSQSDIPQPVMDNISKTMNLLKKGMYEDALKTNADGGPLGKMFAQKPDSYNRLVANLKKIKDMYGEFREYSIIKVRNFDKRVYRILLLYYTDSIPIRFDLVFYKPKDKWVSLYFFFNDEIVKLFDEVYK